MNNRLFHPACLLAAAAALTLATTPGHAQHAGDPDPSFATGPDANSSVHAIALQSNGQVLAGGSFTSFRGAGRNAIARLNPDGSLDPLNPGLALGPYNNNGSVNVAALTLQGDGKIIAAGQFTVGGQKAGGGVVRLNPDGSLDSSFNVGTGVVDAGGAVGQGEALAALPNGQTLVGGAFHTFNGVRVAGLVRLNADGSLDPAFNPGGAGIARNDYGEDVKSIVVQPDGRILIGGHFSKYDGQAAGGVARLNADGTLDPTFDAGAGADYGVNALGLQADGRVLVGGDYNNFDGYSVPHIVRLNPDGSLDTSYYPIDGLFISAVDAIVVQPDGAALVGGAFLSQGALVNSPHNGVARILPDGTQDGSFESGSDSREAVSLALQSDGKALVGSNVYALSGVATGNVSRLFDYSLIPTVTITPGVGKAREDGSNGPATFVLTLSTPQATTTVVKYTLKGAARSGVDYQGLTGKAKIKPGKTTATIFVRPLNRGITGGHALALKAVLKPSSAFTIGGTGAAKVKIVDND